MGNNPYIIDQHSVQRFRTEALCFSVLAALRHCLQPRELRTLPTPNEASDNTPTLQYTAGPKPCKLPRGCSIRTLSMMIKNCDAAEVHINVFAMKFQNIF